jgi:predicted TIM-barrel fold metal-dependent hydrolase
MMSFSGSIWLKVRSPMLSQVTSIQGDSLTPATSEVIAPQIIDVDSHLSEPPDLWLKRLPAAVRDLGPTTITEASGRQVWTIGDLRLPAVGMMAAAGWPEAPPAYPNTEEADPAAWLAKPRIERLDEYGIRAQVLYPNILAFYMPVFLKARDTKVVLDCVRAYNDYVSEFASFDTDRLIPLTLLPFWDVQECITEFKRCQAMGHRGVVFAAHFDAIGQPDLSTGHWDPLLAVIQESGLSVNFHVGFSQGTEDRVEQINRSGANHTRASALHFAGNARAIVDIITTGVCHRFPTLNFVSIESGAGWMPYLLESLDWHWQQFGAQAENPQMELPSVYFKRQIYGAYWFERDILQLTADLLQDNVMFSTDFPHPTSLSPGPASIADLPSVAARHSLEGVAPEIADKILFKNAARVYHLS